MKTFIFFLSLAFSFMTVMNTVANIMQNLTAIRNNKRGTNLLPETVWGLISVCLWTYFYYLTNL